MNKRELKNKMAINKTITEMTKHVEKLEEQKAVFIQAAKDARKKGLPNQLSLAISGLKISLAQQKKANEMLLNFKITSQIKDMSTMTKDFLAGMGVMSKEMIKLTNNKEFAKVQKQFLSAMQGVENQAMELDTFMDMSKESFKQKALEQDGSGVTDDEILKLIDNEIGVEDNLNDQIDLQLNKLQEKMQAANKPATN